MGFISSSFPEEGWDSRPASGSLARGASLDRGDRSALVFTWVVSTAESQSEKTTRCHIDPENRDALVQLPVLALEETNIRVVLTIAN